MLTVYKYPVPVYDDITIEMPKGAEVLTVQVQNDIPQMWALVDPSAPKELRRFRLAGTGHPIIAAGLDYVGTFQLREGALVFHLFAQAAEVSDGR